MMKSKLRTKREKNSRFTVEIPDSEARAIALEGRSQKRTRKAHAEYILCSHAKSITPLS